MGPRDIASNGRLRRWLCRNAMSLEFHSRLEESTSCSIQIDVGFEMASHMRGGNISATHLLGMKHESSKLFNLNRPATCRFWEDGSRQVVKVMRART